MILSQGQTGSHLFSNGNVQLLSEQVGLKEQTGDVKVSGTLAAIWTREVGGLD